MRCFFLRLPNTLKQPDDLHFITSGLNKKLRNYLAQSPGCRIFLKPFVGEAIKRL
jgi:hypothetical protein